MNLVLVGFVTCLSLLQLALVVMGVSVQRRQSRFHPNGNLPRDGISVILPIKGLDPGAADHFRTWLNQDVTCPYEVIFSLQDPGDPASDRVTWRSIAYRVQAGGRLVREEARRYFRPQFR